VSSDSLEGCWDDELALVEKQVLTRTTAQEFARGELVLALEQGERELALESEWV
jgi:hypothetical protein